MSNRVPLRHLWFFLLCASSLVLFRGSLRALFVLSQSDDRYTHTILMPLIALVMVWLDRKKVFREARFCPRVGIPLLVLGGVLYGAVNGLSLQMFAVVLTWIGGFVLCYGVRPLKLTIFPLAFLLLAIPLPSTVVHVAEVGLQRGSAEMAHLIFKVSGMPVLRQGLVFSLPGLDIEVAEQCSGIRSTTALLITVAVAGHLLLRSNWSKLCFVLLTLPISIFKNAVRIAALSWLSVYVSRDFLYGDLHRYGGLPFTLLAVALLLPLLLGLHRLESILRRRTPI